MSRPNRLGIDWSAPDAMRKYKRLVKKRRNPGAPLAVIEISETQAPQSQVVARCLVAACQWARAYSGERSVVETRAYSGAGSHVLRSHGMRSAGRIERVEGPREDEENETGAGAKSGD